MVLELSILKIIRKFTYYRRRRVSSQVYHQVPYINVTLFQKNYHLWKDSLEMQMLVGCFSIRSSLESYTIC